LQESAKKHRSILENVEDGYFNGLKALGPYWLSKMKSRL